MAYNRGRNFNNNLSPVDSFDLKRLFCSYGPSQRNDQTNLKTRIDVISDRVTQESWVKFFLDCGELGMSKEKQM